MEKMVRRRKSWSCRPT